MTVRRQRPILCGDVQRLGGHVCVAQSRNRLDGMDFFRVCHISRGGDVVWNSPPIPDIDRATAAAECLASFVGAQVRR
jgi:hypothetical protein